MTFLKHSVLALAILNLTACNQPPATPPQDTQTSQDTNTSTPPKQDGQTTASTANFEQEITDYKAWATGEVDSLLKESQILVTHIKAGELDKAKEAYLKARVHFERIEPIAEHIGELDARLDRREADLEKDEQWTGFHAIEKQLWAGNVKVETLGDQLLTDINTLKDKISTASLTAHDLTEGAVDLLNEVATSKITGEEEIFSKSDLNVFVANVDGAKQIFDLFKGKLDKALADEIQTQFDAVYANLDKYKDKNGYATYDKLSQDDIKVLAESISKLGEPLGKMGAIFGDESDDKADDRTDNKSDGK